MLGFLVEGQLVVATSSGVSAPLVSKLGPNMPRQAKSVENPLGNCTYYRKPFNHRLKVSSFGLTVFVGL